jgi:lysophospholipase L1-like esterase
MTARLRQVIATAAVFLLGIAAAELSLQVVVRVSPRVAYLLSPPWSRQVVPDSILGFRLSPYAPEIDAWGYRNDSVPSQSPIVTIGDSFTYGFGALTHESWPRQLGVLLERNVYNGGVGGYGPCEYSTVLDRLQALRPEIVIVGVHPGNDLADAYRAAYQDERCPDFRDTTAIPELLALDRRASLEQLAQEGGWERNESSPAEGLFAGARRWLARSSQLYALARAVRYARWGTTASNFEAASAQPNRLPFTNERIQRTVFRAPDAYAVAVDLEDPRIRAGFRVTERALVSMAARTRDVGGHFLVVMIMGKQAMFGPVIAERDSTALPPAFYRLARLEAQVDSELTAVLRGHGIEVVQTDSAIREALRRGEQVYPESEDNHLNGVGYRLLALVVSESLRPRTRQ